MANELQAYTTTGLTIYAVLLNQAGQVWNGSTFVTINSANWTDYDIALTEATAGVYLGNMPAVTAGGYAYVVYEQAGANPAITDTVKGNGWIDWDGSAEVDLADLDALIDAIKAKTDNLPSDPADQSLLEAAITSAVSTIRGADSDTLKTLSDQLDIAQADLDNPNQYKADVSGLATTLHVQEVEDKVDTIDTVADAVKAKTDQLTFTVPNQVDANALTGGGGDPATIADAVWNETLADHLAVGSTGEALNDAGSVTVDNGAIADAVWDELLAGHAFPGSTGEALADAAACLAGVGSVEWDYYLTEPDLVTPIPDATVRVSTDAGGANIIASGITDAFGKVTFWLDPGTYYMWSYKALYTFTNPDTEVVP